MLCEADDPRRILHFRTTMSGMSESRRVIPKSLRVLCFGDSLTAGYTMSGCTFSPYANHLQASLEHILASSDIQIEVAGVSGDQVQGQFLRRIRAKCQANCEPHYDWVIVMGGTNDLAWGQQPGQIYEGLSKSCSYFPWHTAWQTKHAVLNQPTAAYLQTTLVGTHIRRY